jgi:hypothetical protein
MPDTTTVTFTSGLDGPAVTYTDPTGYTFSSQSNLFQHQNGSLFSVFSGDEVVARSTTGSAFGVLSIDLDGLKGLIQNGTSYTTSPGAAHFTFYGVHADGTLTDFVTFTSDGTDGFQTFRFDAATLGSDALAAEFASGLTELHWTVSDGGFNAWGAFDNMVVVQNHAPVATGVVGATSTLPDGTITGHVGATDADGQALTYHLAGTAPAGVVVDTDGTFYVLRQPSDDDLLPGQSRTVTFSYQANDGSEDSAAKSVSFTFAAAPQGHDIVGGNHPQSLCGTAAGERIYGGNSNDTLCGMGGADTLNGNNGNDSVDGGDGRDSLIGANGNDYLTGGAGNDNLDGGNGNDKLVGGEGANVMVGGNGNDTFVGGMGADTMTGNNGNDEFYLGAAWGHDVITDFDPKNDHIHMQPSATLGSWTDFQHLKAIGLIQQVGANVVIDDGAGDTLVLTNVKLTSLAADDFVFI